MKAQGKKLMTMITTAVMSLDELDRIVPAVQDLGRRHGKYGVKDKDYDTVAGALCGLWARARCEVLPMKSSRRGSRLHRARDHDERGGGQQEAVEAKGEARSKKGAGKVYLVGAGPRRSGTAHAQGGESARAAPTS